MASPRLLIVLLVVITCCAVSVLGTYSMLGDRMEHISFVLPSFFDFLGKKCNNGFSRYFCMLGYRTLQNYTDRAPDKRDMAIFKALIEHTYQDINFFSFQPKDFRRRNFGCCTFQLDMYKQYGQGYGMSPAEYYLKLFDLRNRTEGRELVFAKSEWDPDICMNILSKVSFGRGLFRDTGGRGLRFPYLLPPLGPTGDEVIIFNAGRFKREFTFTWFLENVICQEKPGICDPNYQRLFEEQTMAMTMVVNT